MILSIESVPPMIPPFPSLARFTLILLVTSISGGGTSSRSLADEADPDRPSLASSGPGSTNAPGSTGLQDSPLGSKLFESKIRPVLVEHCYGCHSLSAGVVEGGLRLDTRQAMLRGGDRGAAVVAGKPDESWAWKALSHEDPDLRMPPKSERLPDSVIADFRRWIQLGASDPRDETALHSARAKSDTWWSFRPPSEPTLPPDDPWCRTTLDRFILRRLRDQGLRPSQDAKPETILRRLHFDLVGLPPTPDSIAGFLHRVERDGMDQAITQQVDQLLLSPAFGQRWGRHWLDVARFGESSGKESNITFPYAWRYRDYVIDAWNDDIPFNRFLTEQLAGDLLPFEGPHERTRLLIATGFLALGPKNLDATNPQQFDADLVDEQIDAVSRVFMASSVACARCHDHKFDPFSMADYYALAGIFASTKTFFGTAVSPANRVGGDPLVLPPLASTPILHKSIPREKVEKLKADKAAMQQEKIDKGRQLTLRDALRIIWRTGGIDGQLEKVDSEGRALPLAMGVLDEETIRDVPVLLRGEVGRPGDVMPRAFPEAISVGQPPAIPRAQSGRLALAQWLTQPDHPMTSRVVVNRIWTHLFGNGLVASVDDFGSTGKTPSHPQLLDHLAIEFTQGGWSLKSLIRKLVLSRTYRQTSTHQAGSFDLDPENRWLGRMAKRRLEAEAMRDAMLSVSGEIDLNAPVGSLVGRVIGDRPVSLVGLNRRLPRDLDGSVHRSVYLPVLRDRLPDVLEVFDFASPSLVTGQREKTNVPTQALYLMNSDFVQARSEAFAKRLRAETDDDQALVKLAFLYCYGRPPTVDERQSVTAFLSAGNGSGGELGGELERTVLACHALLSTAEFRNLD